MQRRLSEKEIEKLSQARDTVQAILFPTYSDSDHFWREVLKSLNDKIKHGTNDGLPCVEPELTDEDACVWPRRLVMVRDDEKRPWEGPFPYACRIGECRSFHVLAKNGDVWAWNYARPATAEEIKEAGL